MRLNNDVPEGIRKAAIEYNNANGRQSGVNLVLSTDLKKSLLTPILNACVEYGIPFCPCVDSDSFSDERTVGCMVIKESNTPITNIIKRPK
jgi:ferredoxin-thioredoxin reductase catalytic subunit